MRPDLALHALERVVDGLAVAVELLADRRVGVSVEVQREHAGLELGQHGGQAGHQRPQLLGGDDLVDRVVDRRARQDLVQRRLGVRRARRRRGERHVAVERRVLVAGRGLDRGADLAGDAELGEVAERRLTVGPEVADRLVEPDEAFLDEVLGVAAGEEVRRRLQPHERVVTAHEAVVRVCATGLGERNEVRILNLYLSLSSRWRQSGHEHVLPPAPAGAKSRGAHLPRRRFRRVRVPSITLKLNVMQSAGLHAYVDVSSRYCKIVYRRTAAVALTFSDVTRPRIGSATRSSQASATRGRNPFPSAPSTSTTPPDQSGAVYGVFAPAAAP